MEDQNSQQTEQWQSYCGRCAQPYAGGVGRPFCSACEADMRRQNGWNDSEIQKTQSQNQMGG